MLVEALVRDVVEPCQRLVAAEPELARPAAAEDAVTSQPPRRVGGDGDAPPVVQGDVGRVDDRGPPRRRGEDPQGRRPVVDEFEVADRGELGDERREVLLADPPQHLVGPQVLGVEVEALRLVGEAREVDVLGPGQREPVQDAGGRERRRAPPLQQPAVHDAERRVIGHQVPQRALRQQQLARRVQLAVVAGQRQLGQPRLVAGIDARGRDQPQHGLGDGAGVVGVEGLLDGGPHGGVRQHGPRPRLHRAEPRQERVHRLRVDEAQAERVQARRVDAVRDQQSARAAHHASRPARQRHRESSQSVRGGPGERVVHPVPPRRFAVHSGQLVDHVGQFHPPHAERRQRRAPRGPFRRQQPADDGVPSGAALAVPAAEHLDERGGGVHCDRVAAARPVGQDGRLGEPLQDAPADPRVQFPGGDRPGDEPQHLRGDRQLAEQPHVGAGGAVGQEVAQRPGRDVPPVGRERERRDEQRGQVEALVGGRGRVQHARHALGEPALGQGPPHLPERPGPLLDGTVPQELRGDLPVFLDRPPQAAVDDHLARGAPRRGQRPDVPVDVDLHVLKGGQRQHEGRPDLPELPPHRLDRRVPQRQPHDRVEPRRHRGRPLQRERQPQQRHVPAAPVQLAGQARNPLDQAPGPLGRPLDARRAGRAARDAGRDGRGVGHRDDGGEAHPEAPGGVRLVALGRGAERREGLDARGVQRRPRVRGDQQRLPAGAQREAEAAGHAGAPGGVGGVLRQLDDDAVAVAAERVVLLGVGVLAEARRGLGPGPQDPLPQRPRAEHVLHGDQLWPSASSSRDAASSSPPVGTTS
ncbi:hypothetical protein GWI34_30625 [Actinomadura sp. DSM 109109]|nr:hypothetical protein [Actinomadura lepetitiana]